MNALSELNVIDHYIEDKRIERMRIVKDIYDSEKFAQLNPHVNVPPSIYNRRYTIDAELVEHELTKRDLENKIRITFEYEISTPLQKIRILSKGAEFFYNQSKIEHSPSEYHSIQYRDWASEFLYEALKLEFINSNVHFLLGCVQEDSDRLNDAYNSFKESFDLDNSQQNYLQAKIRVCNKLIERGDASKKLELIRDEELLEELS